MSALNPLTIHSVIFVQTPFFENANASDLTKHLRVVVAGSFDLSINSNILRIIHTVSQNMLSLSLSLIVVVIVAGILCCCCLDWRPVPRCHAPPPPPQPRGAAWCWWRQGKGNRRYSPGRTFRMCRFRLGRPSIFSTGQSNNFYPHLDNIAFKRAWEWSSSLKISAYCSDVFNSELGSERVTDFCS